MHDVAIVGGGSAGLALAAELKRTGISRVVILEREKVAGGVPRHCGHYTFGISEYGRLLKGQDYAMRNVDVASRSGVEIRTEVSVTELFPGGRLSLSTIDGLEELQARRVVLCTGVRESSRAQRFIDGDRPAGILSTGTLQSLVYLNGKRPFSQPVIFGSELVSFSAINTCRHLNIRPVAMVEEFDRIVARSVFRAYLSIRGVPLYAGVQSPSIIGDKQVSALKFIDASGKPQRIATDGIIMSGRFLPEAALLHGSHLEMDAGSGGPVVDQFGQCSDPAYYCAGNLLRAAETSAWCWREGVLSARRIAQELTSAEHEVRGHVNLRTHDPAIKFVVPQRLSLTSRPGAMTKMQIALRESRQGILKATFKGKCLWKSKINARPVRRILGPLPDANDIPIAEPGSDVQLSIESG